MQDQNLFLRNDTMLGVCEAIGQDFGFHPNWLRVAICAGLFFNPAVVAAAYCALGVFVALARMIFPVRTESSAVPAVPEAPEAPAASPTPQPEDSASLPLAA